MLLTREKYVRNVQLFAYLRLDLHGEMCYN